MKITLVNGDEWVGLYIDDKLVIENHSLRPREILQSIKDAFGIDAYLFQYEELTPDEDWLSERGRLTKKLKDVRIAN